MNKKVLQKMFSKGLITAQELEDGVLSQERYDLFIGGVELVEGVVPTVQAQIKAYETMDAGDDENLKSYIKSQLRKLEKVRDRGGYTADMADALEYGLVKVRERKEKTQRAEVRRHLQEEGSITSWEAFMDYGVTRLSALIYVLRHEEKMNIESHTITKKNRYGNITNFVKYTLER